MNQFVKMRGKTFCCLFIMVSCIALASACCDDKVTDGDTLESTHECSYGDIKLVGGPNESEGRVETCGQDFHWGTICNTIFANREAMVVCRQLGFLASGARIVKNARDLYGPSTSSIILDDPDCYGEETNILECDTWGKSFSSCTDETYAGVRCKVCNHGDVRLADGPNKTEGRVELCLDEEWLTVCDYGFSSNEAQTICWQLGFIGADSDNCCTSKYGPGTGNIMTGLTCAGPYDWKVLYCRRRELDYTCDHSNDVGVRCIDEKFVWPIPKRKFKQFRR